MPPPLTPKPIAQRGSPQPLVPPSGLSGPRRAAALLVALSGFLGVACDESTPATRAGGGGTGTAGGGAGGGAGRSGGADGGSLAGSSAGGLGGGAGSTAGAGAGTGCNTLELQGDPFPIEVVVGSPPPVSGGTIADGTYDAILVRNYRDAPRDPGAEPVLVQRAFRFLDGATRVELARWYSTSYFSRENSEITYSTSDTAELTTIQACPPDHPELLSVRFSVSTSELTWIEIDGDDISEITLRRR